MNGTLYLITPPTDAVVSVDDAREQLNLPSTIADATIEAMIGAAVNLIDPAGGGWLGRALRPQTWELRSPTFPCAYTGSGYDRNYRHSYESELPYPPLLFVDSVKYDDGDGVEQTLVEGTDYRVFGAGAAKDKGRIAPVHGRSWPSSVRCDPESVRIRFTCGYEIGSVDSLPAPIRQAVLLMMRNLLALSERNLFVSSEDVPGLGSRSFIVTENAQKVMAAAAESLLATHRVW